MTLALGDRVRIRDLANRRGTVFALYDGAPPAIPQVALILLDDHGFTYAAPAERLERLNEKVNA